MSKVAALRNTVVGLGHCHDGNSFLDHLAGTTRNTITESHKFLVLESAGPTAAKLFIGQTH